MLVSATTTDEAVTLLGRVLGKPVVYGELLPFTPSRSYASIALGGGNLGPFNGPSHAWERRAWWLLQRAACAELARVLGVPVPSGSPVAAALRSGARTLHAYSPALFPKPADWDPERDPLTGAWRLSAEDALAIEGDHGDPGFAAWLEDGPPPVYLGFGSMPVFADSALLELAGDLAEALDLRVVLGAGWTNLEGPDCDLPEGVAVAQDCSHEWLFERCCAVVHHGGAGTTHAASASGLPQVVCPVFADQPFWARRVRAAGAGVVLPARRLGPGSLARAVAAALGEPVVEGAAALAQRVRADPGAGGAAAALIRWGAGA